MSHTHIFPQCRGQVYQLSGQISRVFGEDVIQQSICRELSNVFRVFILIQSLQLGLALVELFMVSLFQSNACMTLVHFHCEVSTNSLDREVLSYGLHLFTGIDVVLVGLPVGFYSLHGFSQDRHRADSGGVWCTGEPQVRLGDVLACSHDRAVLPAEALLSSIGEIQGMNGENQWL